MQPQRAQSSRSPPSGALPSASRLPLHPDTVSGPRTTSPPWARQVPCAWGPDLQCSRTRASPGTYAPPAPSPPPGTKLLTEPQSWAWDPALHWHNSLSPNSTRLNHWATPIPSVACQAGFPLTPPVGLSPKAWVIPLGSWPICNIQLCLTVVDAVVRQTDNHPQPLTAPHHLFFQDRSTHSPSCWECWHLPAFSRISLRKLPAAGKSGLTGDLAPFLGQLTSNAG